MSRQVVGRVQPGQPRDYDAAAAYARLDRVRLEGSVWECVAPCEPGQGPAEAPENWIVISAGVTAAEVQGLAARADAARTAADAASAKAAAANAAAEAADAAARSAGAKADSASARADEAGSVAEAAAQKAEAASARADDAQAAANGANEKAEAAKTQADKGVADAAAAKTAADNAKAEADKKLPLSGGTLTGALNLAALAADDYSAKAVSSQWSANRHPQLFSAVSNAGIHVGGNNASDTAGLFMGRGESPDKPFATLDAALAWLMRRYTSHFNIPIILHGDVSVGNLGVFVGNFGSISIQSDDTIRTITVNEWFVCYSGIITLKNLNLAANNCNALLVADGAGAQIKLREGLTFSGTVKQDTIKVLNGSSIISYNDIAGAVTGKRYALQYGSKLLVNGRGPNAIPGTIAGTCDASSVYA